GPGTRRRNASGSLGKLADLDAPSLRPALEIGPRELLGVLGFNLIVERLRVVVVHENERRTWHELLDELEYLLVPFDRHEATHVDHLGVRSLGGTRHIWTPSVARLDAAAQRRRPGPPAARGDVD